MPQKELLRQLVPPLLVKLVRGPGSVQPKYIWKGVYPSFDEVAIEGAGHASEEHIEFTKGWTQYALTAKREGEAPIIPSEYSQFPVLAAVEGQQRGKISIL